MDFLVIILVIVISLGIIFFLAYRFLRYSFLVNLLLILLTTTTVYKYLGLDVLDMVLYLLCPLLLLNVALYVFIPPKTVPETKDLQFRVEFKLKHGKLTLENIRRGISIIGAAGSGKTESVVYNLLEHFANYNFSGVIHDYKDFEITEMAYPLFNEKETDFFIISFERIYHRVNPIAARYLPNEESVNEVARVFMENLLEQKDQGSSGTTKFFNDAAEGILAGLIWKLKTSYPHYCTLPHLITIYQLLDTESLIAFLSSNSTSRGMADAFISGKDSERQTAGVRSTLANALKKITSQKIFTVLSGDEVPLDINAQNKTTIVSVVNNPKYETAYSPVIATIMHTITKQMSVRDRKPSFLLMEEAPTIRLLNMHRIPATLRSYNIVTVYVMKDKIQNDLMYGDKASKAILSNLSYQFFGKVNDPDTAKYYEQFFELIKKETTSINRGHNLDFDTRITKGEKEIPKIRANVFFRLKPGEFITYADGVDKKILFKKNDIRKSLPDCSREFSIMPNKYLEDVTKIFSLDS